MNSHELVFRRKLNSQVKPITAAPRCTWKRVAQWSSVHWGMLHNCLLHEIPRNVSSWSRCFLLFPSLVHTSLYVIELMEVMLPDGMQALKRRSWCSNTREETWPRSIVRGRFMREKILEWFHNKKCLRNIFTTRWLRSAKISQFYPFRRSRR